MEKLTYDVRAKLSYISYYTYLIEKIKMSIPFFAPDLEGMIDD